jgi:pSer/pThr/pTyr-binding forkhead associated (FHA) protein
VLVSKRSGSDHDIESTIAGDVSLVGVLSSRKKEPVLEQTHGPGAPRKLALLPEETVIGRGTQASIQIESSLLSRRHVAFRRSGPDVTCADLDSQNGVYVNAVKVHSALLHDGDTLQMGDVVLVFREAPP